jgi:hypothetical protein
MHRNSHPLRRPLGLLLLLLALIVARGLYLVPEWLRLRDAERQLEAIGCRADAAGMQAWIHVHRQDGSDNWRQEQLQRAIYCAVRPSEEGGAANPSSRIEACMVVAIGGETDPQSMLCRQVLSVAAEHGVLGVVRTLLKKGTSPDSRDQGGETPLMRAAVQRQPAVVRMLLAYGADANLTASVTIAGGESRQFTALSYLEYYGPRGTDDPAHSATVELLRRVTRGPKS